MTKFNYVNRKSDGVKLGEIVFKDLTGFDFQSKKRRLSGNKDNSIIELNLEGKALTDDGLALVARGLSIALGRESQVSVLNLKGNHLTISSLGCLVSCLLAPAQALEEIDLSNNAIQVNTTEDAHIWEQFLRSFSHHTKLSKLLLADNPIGSTKAWEIFDRVHSQQFASIFNIWEHRVAQSEEEEDAALLMGELKDGISSSSGDTVMKDKPSFATDFVMGLPALRALKLCNTGLTDATTVFLSSVLQRQCWMQVNVYCNSQDAKGAEAGEQQGLSYLTNTGLSAAGHRVMLLSAAVPVVPERTKFVKGLAVARFRRNQGENKRLVVPHAASHPQSQSGDDHHHLPSQSVSDELESLRKKIQRSIIEDFGVAEVTLWHVALRMLVNVRGIMMETSFPPLSFSASPASSFRDHSPAKSTSSSWKTNLSEKDFPALPKPRYGILSINDKGQLTMEPPKRRDNSKPRSSSETQDSETPKIDMIGPLPVSVWGNVFQLLVDPDSILSQNQIDTIIEWGTNKHTLTMEHEIRAKQDSYQMMKVLDAIGCLHHDHLVSKPHDLTERRRQ